MKDISRRSFIKWGVAAAAGAVLSHGGFSGVWAQAPVVGSRDVTDRTGSGSRAKVYFSKANCQAKCNFLE